MASCFLSLVAGGRALFLCADCRAGGGAGGDLILAVAGAVTFQGHHVLLGRIFHVTFLCEARTVVFGMNDQEYN